MSDNLKDNWYYAEKGKVIGAISLDEVKKLISEGKIKEDTSVWNGEGEWRAAKTTDLGAQFIELAATQTKSSTSPPPLSGHDIDDKYVWLLVTVPVLGLLAWLLTGRSSVWVFVIILFVLYTVFFKLDEIKLKDSGHEVPKSKFIKVIPVYLWQRAIFLKQKNYYFWGWTASLVLSLFLITALYSNDLEGTACPLVTQILHEQLGSNSATCKVVKLGDKVSDGFYRATAILDNGNDLPITIEDKGSEIYVRIAE